MSTERIGVYTEQHTSDPEAPDFVKSRAVTDNMNLGLSVLAYDSEPGLYWVNERQVTREALRQTLRELLEWVDNDVR